MEWVDRLMPKDWYASQRNAIRGAIEQKNNWYQLILRLYELDPGVRRAFFQNFITNASLKGSATQDEMAKKYNCNIPWAILLDPTTACNLNCTGCWAAEYGHQFNLSLEDIDSIVRQGKELGTYMYIYTGGEPTVRKKDIFKICEMHPDCEFLAFTNGTMIDEEFCQEMLRVKNFVPAISLEGFEKANDGRRGDGVYHKVRHAMELMKEHKLPFGISVCCTSQNFEDVGPCVFIHYSNVNIHDVSLLDALRSPIFQAYHDNQPFNENHLRPCPMLENPERLRELVKETGAVNTDYQDPESVDNLCDRCEPYAENWKPTAEKLWEKSHS